MAIYGTTLYSYFQQKLDTAYSGYLNPSRANALFRDAIFQCTDRRGLDTDSQKAFDEIAQQIITERTFPINNNRISTAPLLITLIGVSFDIYNVTTFFPHNFTQGQIVTLSDLTGNYAIANGAVLITNIGSTTSFNFHITGGGSFPGITNTGSVTSDNMIADYLHLYSVKTRFTQLQEGLTIVNTSGVSPITIRLGQRSKFRDGSIMTLSGMIGTPNANGTWYVKQLNSTSYQLFTDANLTIPSTGGVNYGRPQGVVSYVWEEYAKPLFSDRKINPFENATPELPKFEIAEKVIKFYPQDVICSQIVLDYIRIPQVFIDVADSTFDLSLVYTSQFLYYIINHAIKSISIPLRDPTLNQEITSELITQQ